MLGPLKEVLAYSIAQIKQQIKDLVSSLAESTTNLRASPVGALIETPIVLLDVPNRDVNSTALSGEA